MQDIKEFILEASKFDVDNILKNIKLYGDNYHHVSKDSPTGYVSGLPGDKSEYIQVYGYKDYGAYKNQQLLYYLKIAEIKEYANKDGLLAITNEINKRDGRGFTSSLLLGRDTNDKWGWTQFADLHKQAKKCEWDEELANKFLNK